MRFSSRLFVGLFIGLLLGVLYGWLIRPVEYVDTAPDSLRADYYSEYVLMVAEAYSTDGDLELARVRLAALGPRPPVNIVVSAIDYGLEHGYSQLDLETLNRLVVDLRAMPPSAEIDTP
jgi:hypothetical protein